MLTLNAVFRWFAGVGVAIYLKLSSSIDDVVWLAPFLTTHANLPVLLKNAMVYIAVCLVQTCVAMGIAAAGSVAVDTLTRGAEDVWSTDKILTVTAATILAIYAVKLTYEYISEWHSQKASPEVIDPPEEETTEMQKRCTSSDKLLVITEPDPPPPGCCGSGATRWKKLSESAINCGQEGLDDSQQIVLVRDLEKPCERERPSQDTCKVDLDSKNVKIFPVPPQAGREGQTGTLFVISVVGSVDDLTLFVPMLVSKDFDMVQLVLGGFIAAGAIVLLCVFLGLCKPIANCLSRIPLALIVIVFTIVLIAKAFLME